VENKGDLMGERTKNILVGAAWKMKKNLDKSIAYARKLNEFCLENIETGDNIEVFFLPTFLPLYHMRDIVTSPKLKYGAQNCCWEDEGAFTGEVSPAHLKDAGCTYVELGHAERRRIFGEDDGMLNKKVIAAIRNGLRPILCIGEREKKDNISDTYDFLKDQMLTGLKGVDPGDLERVIIAYEPVWAIGAKEPAPLSYTVEIIRFLRDTLEEQYGKEVSEAQMIFYGGAVSADTAPELLNIEGNDGIFIGRAALDIKYFTAMIGMALEFVRSQEPVPGQAPIDKF